MTISPKKPVVKALRSRKVSKNDEEEWLPSSQVIFEEPSISRNRYV